MNIPIEAFQSFLENKALKPRSIQNYIYYFNKFSIYPTFNQDSVSRFLSFPENRNTVSRSFLLNFKKFLLLNYRSLRINDAMRVQISEVELPKLTGRKKQRIPRQIPHDQIFLIEKNLESEACKIQLLLSYFCALRLGELVKIQIRSFNWQTWALDQSQMGECRVYGKGDKEGIALVPSYLMKRISSFIHTQDFLSVESLLFSYPRQENSSVGGLARTWQKKLREAAIRAGITQINGHGETIEGTSVHPHLLRHSYATHLIVDKGMDIINVKEILRHADIQSTQIYIHISKDHLKKELSAHEDKPPQ